MDADSVTGPYQALRSRRPKGHGLIVSPPDWRGARLRPVARNSGRLRRAGRFTRRQLYGLAAGGSRELPNARFCHRVCSVRLIQRPIKLPQLETFPGAACLPTHRAAKLQRGSPPGVRSAQPAACLQPVGVPFSSFKRSPHPRGCRR
jgi:hypothetical protein